MARREKEKESENRKEEREWKGSGGRKEVGRRWYDYVFVCKKPSSQLIVQTRLC